MTTTYVDTAELTLHQIGGGSTGRSARLRRELIERSVEPLLPAHPQLVSLGFGGISKGRDDFSSPALPAEWTNFYRRGMAN